MCFSEKSLFIDMFGTLSLSPLHGDGYTSSLAINRLIKPTLSAAEVPSRLKPQGLVHGDNKRPDGVDNAMVRRSTFGLGVVDLVMP